MLITWQLGAAPTGVLIAFGSVLAGSLGIPVPTLAALIYLGTMMARASEGIGYGAALFAASMAGAVIGDVAWFSAGRRYGGRVLGLLCRLSLSRDTCVRTTADAFADRGMKVLLIARFIPGLSVVTAPLAGATGVRLGRFVGYAGTGAALWIASGLVLGYLFSAQIAVVMGMLKRFGLDLGGAAIVVTAAYVGISWIRRQRLLRQLRMARISPTELAAAMASGTVPVIIDARPAIQQDQDPFAIPGAQFLRDRQADRQVAGIPMRRSVVVYCSCPNEVSAALIAKRIHKLGFTDVRPLLGGLDAWREAGYPIEPIAHAGRPAISTDELVAEPI